MERFGKALAAKGIASLALDAEHHGERKQAAVNTQVFPQVVRAGITDYRIALDYLKTRKDVDSGRIGLLGYSMGAMMGAILSGVDDRIGATVLCVGGDIVRGRILQVSETERDIAEQVSPSNYVGHISPRALFMINGKTDNLVTESIAKLVHDAAKEPKEIFWSSGGHMLPREDALKGVEWLEKKLVKK